MSAKSELFKSYIDKWVAKTWLGWWKIDLEFCDSHEFIKIEGSDTALAYCHTSWEYMNALIRVNIDELEEEDESEIELIAVHELMHIFLKETQEEGIEHEERVATMLAKSFLLVGGK